VVVLGSDANDRFFGGANSIDRTLNLDGQSYRIIGVLDAWNPMPRFYDTTNGPFRKTEDVFIPLTTAIDRQMGRTGQVDCSKPYEPTTTGFLNSECTWIQFWVNLPTAEAQARYGRLLEQYALEQQRSGRFGWSAATHLRDVRQWLVQQKVVPNEFRMAALLGFAFLIVCLINAVGLILAKFGVRTGEFGVRRALGACRSDVVAQCLLESALLGVLGGIFGLALTHLGLALERAILPPELSSLARMDGRSILLTVMLAMLATVITGLYPAWRASRTQPAWELKTL
jgi:putative ABC transport system permease protein